MGRKGTGLGRRGQGQAGRDGAGEGKGPTWEDRREREARGRSRRARGLSSPLAQPYGVCCPSPAAPAGLGPISPPASPVGQAWSPPSPPGRDIATLHCKRGEKLVFGESRPAPMHQSNCTPIFKALPPPRFEQVPRTLLECTLGMCHPASMGAQLPSSPSPSRRTWGCRSCPPQNTGAPCATVPNSPTSQRRRRTVHVTALLPGKHRQVVGAMAGGQEPGDEWEPSPAPSGSRENAGFAKP